MLLKIILGTHFRIIRRDQPSHSLPSPQFCSILKKGNEQNIHFPSVLHLRFLPLHWISLVEFKLCQLAKKKGEVVNNDANFSNCRLPVVLAVQVEVNKAVQTMLAMLSY